LAEQKALREILSEQLDADALKSFDKYMESHPVLPPPPAGGTPKGSGLDLGVVTPTKVTRRGFAFGNTPGGGIFDRQDIEKYLHTFALTVGRLPMTEDQKISMLARSHR